MMNHFQSNYVDLNKPMYLLLKCNVMQLTHAETACSYEPYVWLAPDSSRQSQRRRVPDEELDRHRRLSVPPVRQALQVRVGACNLIHPAGWRIWTDEVNMISYAITQWFPTGVPRHTRLRLNVLGLPSATTIYRTWGIFIHLVHLALPPNTIITK